MMNDDPQADAARFREVRRVLWAVLVANLAVTVLKIFLGLATGALAVVADGIHSLVDSSSNLIGLAALRLAERPADSKQPYGYQRYETLGALAIGVLMLAAAWEIGRAGVERLFGGGQANFDLLTLVLLAITIPVNLIIVWLETRAGKRLNAEVLLADAAHTRTDLYITGSVFVSMVGVWLGWAWLDIAVAGVVLVLIVRAAFGILRNAARTLSDAAVADPKAISDAAAGVPGVAFVDNVRSRGSAGNAFIDLHVKVDPGMSTLQAHALASAVEERLKADVPGVREAMVHIEPAQGGLSDWQQMANRLRSVADGMGLGIHDIYIHAQEVDGQYAVELHLELPAEISLVGAHRIAEEFEAEARTRLDNVGSIITHLEPLVTGVFDDQTPDPGLTRQLREALHDYVKDSDILDVQVRHAQGWPTVAVRLQMAPNLSLEAAHDRAETIERDLLMAFPVVGRVTVHVEPRSEETVNDSET